MIKAISLENFQSFKTVTHVPLAPLTLIFGPNSAGKSSILRALRLLGQTFTPNQKLGQNLFLVDGWGVNLASYVNLVSGHDTALSVSLGVNLVSKHGPVAFQKAVFTFDSSHALKTLLLQGETSTGSPFTLEFAPMENAQEAVTAASWKLTPASKAGIETLQEAVKEQLKIDLADNSSGPSLGRLRANLKAGTDPSQTFEEKIDAIDMGQSSIEFTLEAFTPRRKVESIAGEKGSEDALQSLLYRQIELHWVRFLGLIQLSLLPTSMKHIPPLRAIPGRVQVVSTVSNQSDQMIAASDSAARDQVSRWLRQITEDRYELDFVTLSGASGEIFGDVGALVLREIASDTLVSFEDAGVGLSQVLPILEWLATSRQAPKLENTNPRASEERTRTLLVEQPELHLHPKMQGKLMDLLVSHVVEAKGKSQVIAETHSEAFLLRLLSAVRSGAIRSSDVAVLFVDKDASTGQTRTQEMGISPTGEFMEPWPESFSDVRFDQNW